MAARPCAGEEELSAQWRPDMTGEKLNLQKMKLGQRTSRAGENQSGENNERGK
jgi:hypothetical protein